MINCDIPRCSCPEQVVDRNNSRAPQAAIRTLLDSSSKSLDMSTQRQEISFLSRFAGSIPSKILAIQKQASSFVNASSSDKCDLRTGKIRKASAVKGNSSMLQPLSRENNVANDTFRRAADKPPTLQTKLGRTKFSTISDTVGGAIACAKELSDATDSSRTIIENFHSSSLA